MDEQEKLLVQPIGYWSGEAYRRIADGRDIAQEVDRLVAAGLIDPAGDELAITSAGVERLGRARVRNRETHLAMKEGVTDDEYATTTDVLRRIVGNLGGDPRLT